jgi:fumarate hydratase class II
LRRYATEILAGKLNGEFPLVIWQTGSGTQSNMNVNEVIAYRAHVLQEANLMKKRRFSIPTTDVNKSQSSNDTFPDRDAHRGLQAGDGNYFTGYEESSEIRLALSPPRLRPLSKREGTHFMDATPLTLGQAFSGFVQQLDQSIESHKKSHWKLVRELALGGTAVGTGLNAPEGL